MSPHRLTSGLLLLTALLPGGAAVAETPAGRPCSLRLYADVTPQRDGTFRVSAQAQNRGRAPVALSLPDRCPAGPIEFSGLPAGYDYYGTCAMGACVPAPRPPQQQVLAPGQRLALATIVVQPAGGSCNAALAPGRYLVRFAPPDAAAACGVESAALIVTGDVPPRPLVRTPPPHAPRCRPMPPCGLACPGPFARDDHGCALCACAKDELGLEPPR